MKIIMFGHKRIPSREGGVEIVVEQLASHLVKLGHQVIVYNRKGHHIAGEQFDQNMKEYKGIRIKTVFTFENRKLNAIVYSFNSAIKVLFSKADVVHIHAEGPAIMTGFLKLFRKRVVVTIHGLDWQRDKWGGFATKILLMGEKQAAKHADEIIVLSKNVQSYFLKTYKRETHFIPNGVTKPDIKEADSIIEKYGIKKDEYILFLSRLVPEKGLHYLIDAYNQLNTDKKLVIAGSSSHTSEYMNKIKDKVKGNKQIIMTGFVQGKTLEELYSNAYLYVLPSDIEGMPLALLEAMSYGNCCLTSDIPENSSVIEDSGITFAKGDISDLKKKLETLINNPEMVKNYQNKSSHFICEKYHWNDIVDETVKLYKKNS